MRNKICILWDIDGTLIHYREPAGDRFTTHLTEQGIGAADVYPELVGTTEAGILSAYLGTNDMTEIVRHLRSMDSVWYDLSVETAVPAQGARDTIRLLGETALQTIVTGNTFLRAVKKLSGAGLLGPSLDLGLGAYGEERTDRGDLVRLAMQRCTNWVDKRNATSSGLRFVCIGDTPLDGQAAAIAGAASVLVATGKYSFDELSDGRPCLVLRSLESGRGDLLQFLQTLEDVGD